MSDLSKEKLIKFEVKETCGERGGYGSIFNPAKKALILAYGNVEDSAKHGGVDWEDLPESCQCPKCEGKGNFLYEMSLFQIFKEFIDFPLEELDE